MAQSNLPVTKIGQYWKTTEGQIPETRLFQLTATQANWPVAGDLVHLDSSGLIERLATTVGSDNAAARTIAGLCVQEGNQEGYLYNPGLQAATFERKAVIQYGGRGSNTGVSGPINQRFIAPAKMSTCFVISRYTDDAVVIGQAYGYRRVAAGQGFLDASITDDVLEVIGFWDADVDGLTTPAFKAIPRVIVRPVLIANL